MLYVSRVITQRKVGVIDTDDNVEEIVSYDDLVTYIKGYGLDIKGVSLAWSNKSGWWLNGVEPFSPVADKKNIKLRMLKGINIVSNGGIISTVELNEDASSETPIRLSEYGNEVAAYAIRYKGKVQKPIVFIIDDNIKFSNSAFKKFYYSGHKYYNFDITELTNAATAKIIYKAMLPDGANTYDYEVSQYGVIDNDTKRADYYKAMMIITDFYYSNYNKYMRGAYFHNLDETIKRVEKTIHKEMEKLSKVDLYWKDAERTYEKGTTHGNKFYSYYDLRDIQNETKLKDEDFINDSLSLANRSLTVNGSALTRMKAFLILFGPVEPIYTYYKTFLLNYYNLCYRTFKNSPIRYVVCPKCSGWQLVDSSKKIIKCNRKDCGVTLHVREKVGI